MKTFSESAAGTVRNLFQAAGKCPVKKFQGRHRFQIDLHPVRENDRIPRR